MLADRESLKLGLTSVELRGLYKDYGRQRALSDVSLTLKAGRVVALLGENGAGKSTLLGILAMLIRPTRGQVLCDGQPMDALDPLRLRRSLGVLSHEPRCYADLSPRENLLFFAQLYGVSAQADASARGRSQLVSETLERVGIARAADRPARTLSRGMLQRLAIARTLLPQPELLLLDEPYTGLDREGVALLTRLLAEERERGALIVVISHDFEAVAPVTDQAAVLLRGRLQAQAEYAPGTCQGSQLLTLYQEAAKRAHSPKSKPGPIQEAL